MTCQKCKGLMVKEWRPDFSQEVAVLRCINCGLVLDPLIAQNRVTPSRPKQRVLDAILRNQGIKDQAAIDTAEHGHFLREIRSPLLHHQSFAFLASHRPTSYCHVFHFRSVDHRQTEL